MPRTPTSDSTGSPGRERRQHRQRLEVAQRALRVRRPRRRRAERTVDRRLVSLAPPCLTHVVAERLQLDARLGQLPLRVRRRELALALGRRAHLLDLRLERPLALLRALGSRSRGREHARRAALRRFGLGEQLADPQPLGCDALARRGDHRLVEAEPRGRLQRVRDAGPPERDPVVRRVRLRVERRRGVDGVVARARPFLQLRVVRRHDRQPRLVREPLDERLRERRALLGVGAGGDLVDEHERAVGRGVEDLDEVRDVAGEGREAHLDRLAVADVGEHLVEDGQRRRLGGRPEAGLVQERREPERLQRDRLAARVRAADHERAQRPELEVDRHGRLRVEQRVPRLEQLHLVGDRHLGAAPAARDDPARDREVDRRRRLDERDDRVRARADRRRQLAQDAQHLLALGARHLGVLVRHLDELERLDEDRLAGVGDVVDDPRHAAARARAHGEDGPAAALGDEVLLQVVAQRRRAREPAQLLGGALLVVAQLLAQAAQLGRGRVAQPGAVRLDRAVDLLGDRGEVWLNRLARAAPSSGVVIASRATRPPWIVAETRASVSAGSAPPRAASSAASRTSWIPASGGSSESSKSADHL